jgi:NADPH:quinone reductase-like Zn-dependent oxidoreductase
MRAIVVENFGGPDVLLVRDVPLPRPAPGDVMVRVSSAGVGPWDVTQRDGHLGANLPYIPGFECAGTVVGDTGDAAGFHDGEPVYGYVGHGGAYAEFVVCPPERLAPLPVALTLQEAGGAPVNLLTADAGIRDVMAVRAGQTVLVTAAAGGLGHLAVQLAVRAGARVVGTAAREHHDFVHKLGAAQVVDHYDSDWPGLVRDMTSGGVDSALASVAATVGGAVAATRDGGIVATPTGVVATTANRDDASDGSRVRVRRYDGPMEGHRLIRLAPTLDDGAVALIVAERFDLEDAAVAHQHVGQGHTRGKIVLVVNED